jgi:hypothetical protein
LVLVDNKSYSLHLERNAGMKYAKPIFYYSIIESGAKYPQSFICILPKNRNDLLIGAKANVYCSLFPNIDRIKFAFDLMNEALITYRDDSEAKSAILKRITLLKTQVVESKTVKPRKYFS